jgi:hypothetical protein
VLNGHLHSYARFAPQDADGNVDSQRGVRQFIVGTEGKNLFSLNGTHNVQFTTKAFGILEHRGGDPMVPPRTRSFDGGDCLRAPARARSASAAELRCPPRHT